MKQVLLWLIRFYRSAISPRKPAMCKYIPTCSQYGLEAIERFGAIKGGGADPVAHSALQPLEPGRLRPGTRKEGKEET